MAALVTSIPVTVADIRDGRRCFGPQLVATASETNLGTPDTSIVIDTRGVSLMAVQIIFANYTSVTVKAQRSLDASTYTDITGATTGTTGVIFSFDPQSPWVRLSLAGTLSGSADTMTVWVYMEYLPR